MGAHQQQAQPTEVITKCMKLKFLGYREFGAWDGGEQRNGKFYWGEGTEAECQGPHVA